MKRALVIGSGGREHSLVWALKNRSNSVDEIFCIPGNAGISKDAVCVDISPYNFAAIVRFAKEKEIDLTIVGPEQPLVGGIVDVFESAGLLICGPNKEAAKLEASKVWAKGIMHKYNIPTAFYEVFSSPKEAKDYINSINKFPVVIKADGLAAGKGVIIAEDRQQAISAIELIMVEKKFGDSGNRVVIEEFLEGEEASIIAVTDGHYILPFASSQDHKRIYDGDRGPNTGGMGAYSSAPVVTYQVSKAVEEKILHPLLEGLKAEGIFYKGVIYAGIMVTNDGPKVLEFNVRFGDPEAQAILPRFKGDFYELMYSAATSGINRQMVNWSSQQCVCVVLASKGYPGSYEKGKVIKGLEKFNQSSDVIVFHAGTSCDERGRIVTSGGRVLGISALGDDLLLAKQKAYEAASKIDFEGKYYRKDIADKGIKRIQLMDKN